MDPAKERIARRRGKVLGMLDPTHRIDYTTIVLDPNPGREMALFAATLTTTTGTSTRGTGKARAR
jgi:hypothetical protein